MIKCFVFIIWKGSSSWRSLVFGFCLVMAKINTQALNCIIVVLLGSTRILCTSLSWSFVLFDFDYFHIGGLEILVVSYQQQQSWIIIIKEFNIQDLLCLIVQLEWRYFKCHQLLVISGILASILLLAFTSCTFFRSNICSDSSLMLTSLLCDCTGNGNIIISGVHRAIKFINAGCTTPSCLLKLVGIDILKEC